MEHFLHMEGRDINLLLHSLRRIPSSHCNQILFMVPKYYFMYVYDMIPPPFPPYFQAPAAARASSDGKQSI